MVCCEGYGDIFIMVRSGIKYHAPEFADGMQFSNVMLHNNEDDADKHTDKSH